ncbi:hypothetical protein WICMUC_002430 [Wickerhamomyces mucosus]|uniref:Nudix hydrolase domain-containing protein n=1 Tax=Wickerhamomyces mucosus TaxID=1378264 RepID=A0A9P8TEQ1_9ASCO|nr:hypothetical protein WICMUC_002430 [Wickerhamomyces mucosus]
MSNKPSPSLAKIVKIEPLSTEEAKWTTLSKITYLDPTGKERIWESASRPTRPNGSDIDAVVIIAILKDSKNPSIEPKILLEKQFRPPTEGVAIEFPAGLVDPGESLEITALRELKEETGYVGEVISKTPILWADPGFCSTNSSIVTIHIDLNEKINQNPINQLEDGEFIETFAVPLKSFVQELTKLVEDGYKIDARVQNIAQGIQLAQQFNL